MYIVTATMYHVYMTSKTSIRITEHTTGDEPYCEVENLQTGEVGTWEGDSESFIREIAVPQDLTVAEVVWS